MKKNILQKKLWNEKNILNRDLIAKKSSEIAKLVNFKKKIFKIKNING